MKIYDKYNFFLTIILLKNKKINKILLLGVKYPYQSYTTNENFI
jgi:hypothetical protein